ncbi:MAG: hypothetical protein ACOZQL_23060 [Myxococcota bacterium]
MSKPIALGVILFVVGFFVGRISVVSTQSAAPVTTPLTPTATAAPTMPMGGAQKGGQLRGKVAEVIQVPQYTYLRLESGEWAAVESQPTLTAGQDVTVNLQTEMHDFSSPSLGRTFASLWFGTLDGAAPGARTTAAAPMPAPVGQPEPAPEVKAALAAVDSASALTMRVVDVYGEKAMLSGKRVKVKGTVDRLMEVQGFQYIHLKDGTGVAAEKTDDLLVISKTPVEKGAAVVMEGVVALNKDIGMGPVPVVLDQAAPVR